PGGRGGGAADGCGGGRMTMMGWYARARSGAAPRCAAPIPRIAGVAALFIASALAVGCEDSPMLPQEDPPDDLEIAWTGRAERGLALVLEAALDGEPLAPGAVTWRVEPAAAGTWRGDTLRLDRAGSIRVTAEAGELAGAVELDVAVPPMILFDMVVDGNRDLSRGSGRPRP